MASRTAAAIQGKQRAKAEPGRASARGGRQGGRWLTGGVETERMRALQRSVGNQAVLRLIAASRPGRPSLASPTQSSIQRGGGNDGAGHADAWSFSKDKRYVIKITSKDE